MKVVISSVAQKYLDRLSDRIRRYVLDAIYNMAADTKKSDVKRLKGREGRRLRVGNLRVIYTIEKDCLTVVRVAPRGDVYKERVTML